MKLIADEGVDVSVVECLREHGHAVLYVAEQKPGISDDAVLALANRQDRHLITSDKDFGQLVFRQGRAAHGVILLRLAGVSSSKKAYTVLKVIEEHGDEMVEAFSVIRPGSIRIRCLHNEVLQDHSGDTDRR